MGDVGFWTLLQSPGPPLYIVALIVFVMAFKASPLIMARILEGRRDVAKATANFLDRLERRIKVLEDEKVEDHQRITILERENIDCHKRVADLEGYNMGRGSAQQEAARIVAVERLEIRAKSKAEIDDPKIK